MSNTDDESLSLPPHHSSARSLIGRVVSPTKARSTPSKGYCAHGDTTTSSQRGLGFIRIKIETTYESIDPHLPNHFRLESLLDELEAAIRLETVGANNHASKRGAVRADIRKMFEDRNPTVWLADDVFRLLQEFQSHVYQDALGCSATPGATSAAQTLPTRSETWETVSGSSNRQLSFNIARTWQPNKQSETNPLDVHTRRKQSVSSLTIPASITIHDGDANAMQSPSSETQATASETQATESPTADSESAKDLPSRFYVTKQRIIALGRKRGDKKTLLQKLSELPKLRKFRPGNLLRRRRRSAGVGLSSESELCERSRNEECIVYA